MRPEVWEDLGEAGLKMLLAIYEAGGEADFNTIAYIARVGRSSWYRLSSIFTKYGLVESYEMEGARGVVKRMKLTPKGFRVAALLKRLEEELLAQS